MTATTDRRTQLLVEGRRLVLRNGYTATAIDAICEAAGVTKGAFFHHFRSKDDFAAQVLAYTWEPVPMMHDDLDIEASSGDRLAQHIAFMAGWIAESGRLMPLMAQELAGANPEIRSQIGSYFAAWMGYLDELLAAAARESPASPDLEALKEFIVATTEGIPVVLAQFGEQALSNVTAQLVSAVNAAFVS